MSTQHTPGPWHISGSTVKGPHPKDPQNRLRIVAQTVFDKGTWIDETRANARLIAAAPDLLEALQYMANVCPSIDSTGDDAHTKARATIAKATGVQHE
jgi:hypothetical protein